MPFSSVILQVEIWEVLEVVLEIRRQNEVCNSSLKFLRYVAQVVGKGQS